MRYASYADGMQDEIPLGWEAALGKTLARPELTALSDWLEREEAAGRTVLPARDKRFRALALTLPEAVRVVILGQDPYHGPGQATGLAFAVPPGVRFPPSLANIVRELVSDVGCAPPLTGDLSGWARQGVLLLNTSLSVEAGKAGSHARRGWELLTDAVVSAVAHSAQPAVFILWGAHAQAKLPLVEQSGAGRHLVIASPHPSPLSAYRGFFGSRPFSRANAFLRAAGRGTIDWCALV